MKKYLSTKTWEWLSPLTTAAICFVLLYAWEAMGSDLARNVLLFFLWSDSAIYIAFLLAPIEITKLQPHFKNLNKCELPIFLLMTFALLLLGHVVTAVLCMLGWSARKALAEFSSRQAEQ